MRIKNLRLDNLFSSGSPKENTFAADYVNAAADYVKAKTADYVKAKKVAFQETRLSR